MNQKSHCADKTHTHTENRAQLYLREAAVEGVVFTALVFCVQAVVEEAGMAGVHTLQTDVKLHLDAAPQVVVAAGELSDINGQ